MIAGDTEFANHILHRDISLLLANLHNVGKLLIRLLRSKFHIPILAAATVRTTFQSFQEFLRGLNFQTADSYFVGRNQVALIIGLLPFISLLILMLHHAQFRLYDKHITYSPRCRQPRHKAFHPPAFPTQR